MLPQYTAEEWKSRIVGKSCRIVCELDETRVVKFGCPRSRWTGLQNITEREMWESIDGTHPAVYFAGTLAGADDGSWNIQEAAPGVLTYGDERITPEHRNTPSELGLRDGGSHQMGIHYLTGEVVIRDYGISPEVDTYNHSNKLAACGECMLCQLAYMIGMDIGTSSSREYSCDHHDMTSDGYCQDCSYYDEDVAASHQRRVDEEEAREQHEMDHGDKPTFDHPNSCRSRGIYAAPKADESVRYRYDHGHQLGMNV